MFYASWAGKFQWCSNYRDFEPKEVTWGVGEPKSGASCVFLKHKGVNASDLATSDCAEQKRFICDVRQEGTEGIAMQQECLDIWGITDGKT